LYFFHAKQVKSAKFSISNASGVSPHKFFKISEGIIPFCRFGMGGLFSANVYALETLPIAYVLLGAVLFFM
jgi:hypothetical protein